MAEISNETQHIEGITPIVLASKDELNTSQRTDDLLIDEMVASSSLDNPRKESLDNCWITPEWTELENVLKRSSSNEEKTIVFNKLFQSYIKNIFTGLKENESSETIAYKAHAIHRILISFGFHFRYTDSCIENLCAIFSAPSLPLTAVKLLSESIGILTLLKDQNISNKFIKSGIVGITLGRIRQAIMSNDKPKPTDEKDENDDINKDITQDVQEQSSTLEISNNKTIRNYSDSEKVLCGCLWTLCNIALNPSSHEDFIKEDAGHILTEIVMRTTISSHVEYSLYMLVNLFK